MPDANVDMKNLIKWRRLGVGDGYGVALAKFDDGKAGVVFAEIKTDISVKSLEVLAGEDTTEVSFFVELGGELDRLIDLLEKARQEKQP